MRVCVEGWAEAGGDLSVSVRGQSEKQAAAASSLSDAKPSQPPCEHSTRSTASYGATLDTRRIGCFPSANPPNAFLQPKLQRCLSAFNVWQQELAVVAGETRSPS